MCSDLTLGPSFKVKRGKPKLKMLITRLLLVPQVCNVKPTDRKSLAGNLLMLSDLTLGPSFRPLIQGQMRTAKLKSTYNLLIIGPRGFQCETNLKQIMGWESFDVVRFDLGPLLQGQMQTAKTKSAHNLLIIGPRGLQCETNLQDIMGWESSDVRFDFGPLQGQTMGH